MLQQLLIFLVLYSVSAKPYWPPQVQISDDIKSSIDRVYLVSSCHLDLGFADSLVNIVNMYFDRYFPDAIRLAEELRQANHEERLVFTTHSYLVWLYLNCPPDTGLHCPEYDAIDSFRAAISKGDIAWHAFPFNAQPEVYDRSMADFGFRFTMNISKELGYIPLAMSQRDVPGLTRSLIPIMKDYGVLAVTVGVNEACMPPAVPTAFKWLDPVSGKHVIGMWHPHGYGYTGTKLGIDMSDIVLVPGMNTALAFAIRGDNSGPPPMLEIFQNYEDLRKLFPYAEIVASSYNEFVQELASREALLPVYKEEIGDTWIHGAGSDPWKTAKYREILRLRNKCLEKSLCDINEQTMFDFSAFLLKYGEHTWGKDIKKYLHDTENWTNERFRSIVNDGLNFIDVANSWIEQRKWGLDYALEALKDNPLKDTIESAVQRMYFKGNFQMDNFTLSPSCQSFEFGSISLSFDTNRMSIISLQDKRGGTIREYSGLENPLALMTYTSYTGDDFKNFLDQYLLDKNLDYAYQDLGKPGLSDAIGVDHIVDYVSVTSCWTKSDNESMIIRLKGSFSTETIINYGGSQFVYLDVIIPLPKSNTDDISLDLVVYIVDKTSTRIPESLTVMFQPNPNLVDPKTLSISKLDEYINALDVIANGSKHVHASDKGIKYGDPVPLTVFSWDTEVVTIGGANLFPVPMETPDVSKGFGFNIYNNLWGTNYIMWYPYQRGEESSKYRFKMTLPSL